MRYLPPFLNTYRFQGTGEGSSSNWHIFALISRRANSMACRENTEQASNDSEAKIEKQNQNEEEKLFKHSVNSLNLNSL